MVRKRSGNPDFALSARKSLLAAAAKTGPQTIRKSLDTKIPDVLHNTMWTDMYQPVEMDDLVGNEGAVDQLLEWLKDWDDVVLKGVKKAVPFRFGASWKD